MTMPVKKVIEDAAEELEIPEWMHQTILERYHQSVANPSRGERLDVVRRELLAEFPASD